MKTYLVQDCYVTLDNRETHDAPFVVYLRFTDGSVSQKINCASLRDALICGNGMLSGIMAVRLEAKAVNVVFDPIFNR